MLDLFSGFYGILFGLLIPASAAGEPSAILP
jgi:hypothetical protein